VTAPSITARSLSLSLLAVLTLAGCGQGNDGSGSENTTDDSVFGGICELQAPTEVPNEGADHVSEGTMLTFESNPPASGSHYPIWARFEAFDPEIVPRGYWVHNLEHGGVALLAGPEATNADFEQLLRVYDGLPDDPQCGHRRVLLTRDPELPVPIAAVAWNWTMLSSCVDPDAIGAFVEQHRANAPEDVCGHGTYVP